MKNHILLLLFGLTSPLLLAQKPFFYSLQGGLNYSFMQSKEISREFLYARNIERDAYAYNDGVGLTIGSSFFYTPTDNMRLSVEVNTRYTYLTRFDIITDEKIFLQKNLFYLIPVAKVHFRLQQTPLWYSIGVGGLCYLEPYYIWQEARSSIEQTIHPWVPFISQEVRYEVADKYAFSLSFFFGLKNLISIRQFRRVVSMTLTDTEIQPQKDIYYSFRAIELTYHHYLNFK